MFLNHPPGINEKERGIDHHVPVVFLHFLVQVRHRGFETHFLEVGGPFGIGGFQFEKPIRVYRDYSEVARFELSVQLHKMGSDFDAWRAAGKPEVNQVVLALELRRRESLSIERLESKWRSVFSRTAHQRPFQHLTEAPILLYGFDINLGNLASFGISLDELGNARVAINDRQQYRSLSLHRKVKLTGNIGERGNLIGTGLVLSHEQRNLEERIVQPV